MPELSSQRLLRFARSLKGAQDFAEVVRATAAEIKEALGYAHTWLTMAEDEAFTRVRLIAITGPQAERAWEVAPVLEVRGDAYLEALACSHEPVVVRDARLDPRTHKPTVEALQNRTLINLPFILFDRSLGFLGVGTFGDEGCRTPTPSELSYLVGLTSQLSVAAARVRFSQERRKDDEERRSHELRRAQQQRVESVGILAGGVAHHFNDLLTTITSNVALAQATCRDSMALANLDAALAAAQSARALSAELLAMSRSQPLDSSLLDLNQLVSLLSDTLRTIFPQNVSSELNLGEELPAIDADGPGIDRVLMILCCNARDAMAAGGRLTIATQRVELSDSFVQAHPWAKAGQYLLTSVSDTGNGMSKDTLARVFEPFFTTKASLGGIGLGLAVAYAIVSQHDGLLHAHSELGVGSTFEVYLPIAPAHRPVLGTR